jgi:type I restriction enzyme, S subunit
LEVKSGYKHSEAGFIPSDWDAPRLDSLGGPSSPAVKAGPFGSALTKDQYVPSGFKVYGQEQVIRGDHLYGDYFITQKKYRELESCAVRPGDILLSLVGTVGKLLEVPVGAPPGVINPRLLRFSLDSARVLPSFFKYQFQSSSVQSQLSRQAQGGTMGVLNAGALRPFRIPLPSLPEQESIAEALTDVDALLSGLDRLIAKKRDLKQAAMQQLLTGQTRLPGFQGEWEMKRLGDLGVFLKGSGVKKDDARSGDLPCVRYGEIYTHHNDCIRSFNSWISHDVAKTATRLKSGDLLFAGSGETKAEIGKCVAFVQACEAYAGGDIVILRPVDVDSLFMGYYCNTSPISAQKASKGQGDAVVHISSAALGSISVAVPALAEQSAIATVLSDMDAELTALEARRDKTRLLKQGMMQELLTGRTRLV